MKLTRIAVALATCAVAAAMALPAAAFAEEGDQVHVYRIGHDTAEETAAYIAAEAMMIQQDVGTTGDVRCDYAVIARNDDFADAMSAVGLAGALKCPILLTDRNSLSEITAEALSLWEVKTAYVIGGPGAIKSGIDSQISSLGITPKRIYGDYSWDTSLECAHEIDKYTNHQNEAIGAMSINFQDALSISTFAYSFGLPIILQTDGATSADRSFTADGYNYLYDMEDVIIVGGPGAISEESTMGLDAMRVYGETGYDTSYQIAQSIYGGDAEYPDYPLTPYVVVACGAQAAHGVDALAGAVLAGTLECPILLVNDNPAMEATNLTSVDTFMTDPYNWPKLYTAYALGGTYVMPEDTVQHILDLLANG